MNRFQKHYELVVRPDMLSKFNYNNIMEVPRITKIVISMGVKEAVIDKKQILPALLGLEYLSGQRGLIVKSKKSISGFKLRENTNIGCKVTLRNEAMYYFFDHLVSIVLPRIRDFKRLRIKQLKSNGSYSLGISNFFFFPEVEFAYNQFNKTQGLNITIVTNAKTSQEAQVLLSAFQLPF